MKRRWVSTTSPTANITIRPEVRYDWYTGPGGFRASERVWPVTEPTV